MLRLFPAIAFLVSLSGWAQVNTSSPYSIYGIGDPAQSSNAMQLGMGHTSLALVSPTVVLSSNAASSANLRYPTFNFDLRQESLTLASGTSRQNGSTMSVQSFAFGFPLLRSAKRKRHAGFMFGISPYTRMGYSMRVNQVEPELGPVSYLFKGQGGINNFYTGLSYDLLAMRDSGELHALTLGLNFNYVFGNQYKIRATQFDPTANASNLYRVNRLEVSDADVSLGLQYKKSFVMARIGRDTNEKTAVLIGRKGIAARHRLPHQQRSNDSYGMFSIGITYRPSSSLRSFNDQIDFAYRDTLPALTPIDTITNTQGQGSVRNPSTFGVGTSLNIGNVWTIGVDYTVTHWSQLRIHGLNSGLNDASRVSGCVEYVPDMEAYKEFMKTLRYRVGGSYEKTMFSIGGIQPHRYGINFGLGIPIMASKSGSMLNLGAEYAVREKSGILLSENYFNAQVGFVICPDLIWDQWFVRRKFD